MNFFKRLLLDRRLKHALLQHNCRLDRGIRGLRKDTQLTLEHGVKLYQIKIHSKQLSAGATPTSTACSPVNGGT